MSVEIRPAREDEIIRFFADSLTPFQVALVDGEPVAMAIIYHRDDKWWAAFNVKDGVKAIGAKVVLALRRGLVKASRNHDANIYVQCADDWYPTAARLCRLLGFTPTDETVGDMQVLVFEKDDGHG